MADWEDEAPMMHRGWSNLILDKGANYAGPVVLASVAYGQKTVEPAGAAYMRLQQKQQSGGVKVQAVAAAKVVEVEEDFADPNTPEGKRRLALMLDAGNHYELLGLGHLTINATDEQIRKAYRKAVLKYHPDKTGSTGNSGGAGGSGGAGNLSPAAAASGGEATDPLFLAVQKAYDTLSNEEKRRAYDSQFEFDDSIPSGNEALPPYSGDNPAKYAAAFFALYGPVFERNARFSARKPVPKLGDLSTPDDAVAKFYSFWFTFDSWRDFSSEAEHNLDDAEDRFTKRAMERENKAAIAKLKKAEIQRLTDLTQRAYARDPRMLALRAREEAEKQAAHEARQAAKRATEEAARRAEAEKKAAEEAEAAAKKEEERARKAARDAEKRAVKRARADLKRVVVAHAATAAAAAAAATGGEAPLTEADVEWLCGRVDPAGFVAIYERTCDVTAAAVPSAGGSGEGDGTPGGGAGGGGGAPVAPVKDVQLTELRAAVREARRAEAEEKAELERKRAAAATAAPSGPVFLGKAKEEIEWSVQEVSMLAKAVAKFPGGTRNRWAAVASFVNNLGQAIPRTPEECIAKAAKIEEEKKKVTASAFALSMAARKETEVRDRDAVSAASLGPVAAVTVVGPDGKPVKPAAAAPAPAAAATASAPAAAAAPAPAAPAPPAPAAAPAPAPAPAAAPAASAAAAAAAAADGEGGADEAGEWSPEQQTALEAALRKFPASMDKAERWKAIAEAVPGKNRKQCVARFKWVREQLLAKKS